MEESTCRTPLIFVLSPGVDPTGALLQLAEASGMGKHFHALSLGQGQAPVAKRMIEEGVKNGRPPSLLYLCSCASVSDSFCYYYLVFFSQVCFKKRTKYFNYAFPSSCGHPKITQTHKNN